MLFSDMREAKVVLKKKCVLLAGKVLTAVASVFAATPCAGRMYEAEVPEMLRK